MADVKKILPENVKGEFFVDSTCIDCDACRQLAPEVFASSGATHMFIPNRKMKLRGKKQFTL
jgi:ferredoxin